VHGWLGNPAASAGMKTAPRAKEEPVRTNAVSVIKGLFVAVAIVMAMGCSGQPLSTREKGTFIGTGVGAATGAIIGAAVGNPLAGAAIGGGIGALGGFAVGNEMQNRENENAQTQSQISSQQRQIESQQKQIQQLKSSNETE
jgi:Glycine zipper